MVKLQGACAFGLFLNLAKAFHGVVTEFLHGMTDEPTFAGPPSPTSDPSAVRARLRASAAYLGMYASAFQQGK
eukprot:8273541-Pyramimonas_sp.AAC.1